ncbi:NF-X1 type zinc finger protein [Pseudomassariella vexata]|uniref:NF-X1 type zinc finger protein n=1 Tax=Pseudomassariella vexata TaxID=1141098 RepID=A0A1Y2E381_9PEZI|nr:NF-X1 type zinc finger protein [Pseudomassariella vexata]ORY65982.1 NF-X1 type zinc finger protein [Pseudomassariella vexata]
MADVPLTAANAAADTGGSTQRPNRGRAGRGRGGRHRGGNQNRERNHGQPTSDAEPILTGQTSAPAGESTILNARGRGRRGPRKSRRGGAEPTTPRTTFGTQRAFGGHLTTEAQSAADIAAGLSADAPEFVPGQPLAPRNGQPPPLTGAKKSITHNEPKSNAPDLPTRIHDDISNGNYECVICTNEVLRNSRVWSCSICWTVTHLTCVRKWHTNQIKQRDQNIGQVSSDWRCPGCNSGTTEEPTSYHCWCGKEISPRSLAGQPPHSCSQTCGKPRGACPHPCMLVCHAGPCPPCDAMGPALPCYCGKHVVTKRCRETDYTHGWSCQEICGDLLPCSEHECQQPCHSGLCGSCEIPIPSLCYCGRVYKEIPCEQREQKVASFDHGQVQQQSAGQVGRDGLEEPWFGATFSCDSSCERTFDCGHHRCTRACHAQDEKEAHCPFSPDVVTHCPCTKTPLDEILEQPRQNCQDAIPSCNKTCDKLLPCGHRCRSGCHASSCPPCMQKVEIECRCGRTKSTSICHQGETDTPECMRVCRAQLNCGRHLHDEHCCPSEKKAMERKRKRKNLTTTSREIEAEHICVRVCGRLLKCDKHQCAQLCHPGPCSTCPEAIFEEISCHCGRTVLQPPQPCGTRPPECRFECARPNPCQDHPRVSHTCHGDDKSCSPCPFLVEKRCICGKSTLKNQPCASKQPRCGLVCNRKLKCGHHSCTKTCHGPGDCEDAGISGSHCSQPCLKVRKSCDHVCTETCHCPYACKEDKPCQAKTFVTCECQRRKQEVRCLATKTNPSPERPPLKCDDECLRLQRNARLASALNVEPATHTDDHVPYSDKTLELYQSAPKWAQTYEREFRVFSADTQEKRLRFKPMKPHHRAFLHALAEDFGLDSESQDPEPHRHVSIFKTPRFVSAPAKTLAQCVKIKATDVSQAQPSQSNIVMPPEPFNALLLSSPKFGLTIEELESALAHGFASQPNLSFATSFLPSDDVVIKGSGSWTPQALESSLSSLKPAISQSVKRHGLAKSVALCHVDSSLNVLRREAGATVNTGGWSSVVGRSTARQAKAGTTGSSSENLPVRSRFMALRKEPKKKAEEEPVEEDWLTAAEKLDED